ncbi:MAG: tyrosine--tRNA ligase, partial [Dehalococcoidia bacterium]|nr:tyrosine--tRNA ligase [Dehalococcoidia bacterium]
NDAPNDMYGKVMSVPDSATLDFFTLVTPLSPAEVGDIRDALEGGSLSPMDAKKRLAKEIVAAFYNADQATEAQAYFESTIQRQETPDEMPEFAIDEPQPLNRVLTDANLAASGGEVRRLVKQGAVSVNEQRISDFTHEVKQGDEIRVGRHKFLRLTPRTG